MDSPGTLHHVMVRGIEGIPIFRADKDRKDFLTRIEKLTLETGTKILAWALMDNHVHLLLFSGPAGISVFMRRLLTGYAIAFNLRYRRNGHLFQNRYKSIVCEENPYFLELVRYIHLNPLRAMAVRNLDELEQYPWSGHQAIIHRGTNEWQEREYVLRQLNTKERKAISIYRDFMESGKGQGRRPELVGGGLIRSLGGWSQVLSVQVKREPMEHDTRILGSGDFVTEVMKEAEKKVSRYFRTRERDKLIDATVKKLCFEEGVSERELRMGGRTRKISGVRAKISCELARGYGLSRAEIARHLGVSTSAIARVVQRNEASRKC
ncbi:MAG TPA: transposase [Thermodesulfobacteriota bacterium]|nr:transposase [Thermodesulfobacteriota bacterium]